MNKETQKTLLVAVLFIVLLGAVKHGSRLSPSGTDIAFAIAFLFQVFVPIWLIERDRLALSDFKICLPQSWAKDLTSVLFVSILTLPLYFLAYYGLQAYFAGQNGMTAHFEIAIPPDFLTHSIANLALIALSEELFYRGYIQTRLLKQWPVMTAFIVTNIFFALGHFIGDYNFARLLPFFPGLIFSFMAWRSKSIAPAVLYHGICNIFSELLRESFFWK